MGINITPEMEEHLRGASDAASAVSGLLFHGTCETFDLIDGGGYDGMVWTTNSPAIAQTYIPVSGIEAMVSAPDRFGLDQGIRPDESRFWPAFAMQECGLEFGDIEWSPHGQAMSWAFKKHVTYREAVAALESLGYDLSAGPIWVSQQIIDGRTLTMPADWRMPGRLLFCRMDPNWRWLDISRGDSDLTDLQYHAHEAFDRAVVEGYDGVIIDDFAQHRVLGNVGHRSWGLLPRTAQALTWSEIPASSTKDAPSLLDIPGEFEALFEGLKPQSALSR
ncbi:conserved hypothetical protein [Hyphomicrobiales bacterium]|jgi:hypothetical protein|nr:conserved hypothetical protein [Hyphomicrobiales bacterium]CAH1702842.1 conserved hypothetical protein [Hyphomicrobiales bacterium]CAI0347030.1 conserved hypothetical protein [Hyphomicrobiales bacterium]